MTFKCQICKEREANTTMTLYPHKKRASGKIVSRVCAECVRELDWRKLEEEYAGGFKLELDKGK